jgi:hypothetical protein
MNQICSYILYLIQSCGMSTVLTYMSAISFLLQLGGYEDLPGHFMGSTKA